MMEEEMLCVCIRGEVTQPATWRSTVLIGCLTSYSVVLVVGRDILKMYSYSQPASQRTYIPPGQDNRNAYIQQHLIKSLKSRRLAFEYKHWRI